MLSAWRPSLSPSTFVTSMGGYISWDNTSFDTVGDFAQNANTASSPRGIWTSGTYNGLIDWDQDDVTMRSYHFIDDNDPSEMYWSSTLPGTYQYGIQYGSNGDDSLTINWNDFTITSTVGYTGPIYILDSQSINFGTSTGGYIGQDATQKFGFWGASPITRPASSKQAALTNSTGGTPGTTLGAITAGASYSQTDMTNVKTAIASLWNLTDGIRTALVNAGLIKGAA